MNMGLVIAGGIVVLALIAISVYGAVTLPAGSRIPLHHGIGGWNNWQPKNIALVAYPAIGVLVFVLLLSTSHSVGSNGRTAPAVIAPIAMLVLAFVYYSAMRAAIRESGRNN
jgi:hypothetical protein